MQLIQGSSTMDQLKIAAEDLTEDSQDTEASCNHANAVVECRPYSAKSSHHQRQLVGRGAGHRKSKRRMDPSSLCLSDNLALTSRQFFINGVEANGMQKTICATRIDNIPSLNPMAEKNISVATAVTISGTMIGSEMRPKETDLPRKLPPLTMPIAAAVAITVATVAAATAIVREFQAASLNFSDSAP